MKAILKGRETRADMAVKEAADKAGENADAELGKLESGEIKQNYISELDTGDLDDMKAMMLANKIQSGKVALGELTPDDKSKINIFIKNNPDSISSKGLAIAIKNKLSS